MASIQDPMPLWEKFWASPTLQNQAEVAEHYVSVCYTIAGDFGKKYRRHPREFWSVAWLALHGRVPHWRLGDAPFANYAAIRVRGAIMDSIGANGWRRHNGGEEVCHDRDDGYLATPDSASGDCVTIENLNGLAALVNGADVPFESQVIWLRLQVEKLTLDQLSAKMNKPVRWLSDRKREVEVALAERVRDREHAAELLSAG